MPVARAVTELGFESRGLRRGLSLNLGVLRRFASQASRFLAPLTAALGGLGAVAAVKLHAGFETTQIAFESLIGSAAKAEAILMELWRFAATTPFEFPELAKNVRFMKAMGFETAELLPMLRKLGDAAAAMGDGTPMINRVVRALGQMRSLTRVTTEEMNQLSETGLPAFEILSKGLGISVKELRKQIESGTVDAFQAIDILVNGFGERFEGATTRLASTLAGRWSTFKDNVTALMRDAGKEIAQSLNLKQALKDLTDQITGIGAGVGRVVGIIIRGIRQIISSVMGWIRANADLLITVAAITSMVGGTIAALVAFKAILASIAAGVVFLLSPLGLLIAGLTALSVGLLAVIGDGRNFFETMRSGFTNMLRMLDIALGSWEGFKRVLSTIGNQLVLGLFEGWMWLRDKLLSLWDMLSLSLKITWTSSAAEVKAIVSSLWAFLKQGWEGLRGVQEKSVDKTSRFMLESWLKLQNKMGVISDDELKHRLDASRQFHDTETNRVEAQRKKRVEAIEEERKKRLAAIEEQKQKDLAALEAEGRTDGEMAQARRREIERLAEQRKRVLATAMEELGDAPKLSDRFKPLFDEIKNAFRPGEEAAKSLGDSGKSLKTDMDNAAKGFKSDIVGVTDLWRRISTATEDAAKKRSTGKEKSPRDANIKRGADAQERTALQTEMMTKTLKKIEKKVSPASPVATFS